MLTKALIQNHAGRAGYDVALLDVAQDHALYLLQATQLLDRPGIVLKGGTSLRKCRLGSAGRFSTDLDFAVPDETDVLDVCDAIDGARVAGFSFSVTESSSSGRIWSLEVTHAQLGNVAGIARLEFAKRRLSLPAERLAPIDLAVHRKYGFKLAPIPVIAEVEACAEKLARYRRTPPLARDLYDLAWFATRPINERLLRRLWVLKVYCDVVEDGRGSKPFAPSDLLKKRDVNDFPAAPIDGLTQAPDIPGWEARVRARFAFLADMDIDEQRFTQCNPRDHEEVLRLLGAGGFA